MTQLLWVLDPREAYSPIGLLRTPVAGNFLFYITSSDRFVLHRLLLLEAGPKDTSFGSKLAAWKIHMPAALTYNLSRWIIGPKKL